MHPGEIAAVTPDKPAYVMADSGQVVTYEELEVNANQGAHLFRRLGLKRGDHIALMLENHPRFLQLCWAAQRAGLYYTPVSWRLQLEEIAYIVNDCEARVLISSAALQDVAAPLADKTTNVEHHFMLDGVMHGYASLEDALAMMPQDPIADQSEGGFMFYSSGTTGYPKGIRQKLAGGEYGDGEPFSLMTDLFGATDQSIYLSTAPLYHSAPLAWAMNSSRRGITSVIMEHFEPELALQCIEKFRITHSQWVPTMFVRMLKLPPEVRTRYDLSAQQCAIHGAAPCPVPVKEQMIAWWGEILHEYYGGTEGNGFTHIKSAEWLDHRGSVGRPMVGEVHICNEAGEEVAAGERGTVFFGGGNEFEYFKDPLKTAAGRHPRGWSTLGDIGYIDADGYLYLTDRKDFTIISGGVNIYPQEAENVLIMHEKVLDVAVFGIPNEEFGEEVKAAVQLKDPRDAGSALEAELLGFCRESLSHFKCPRSIDFHEALPRHPTGKLYKRLLKDAYWPEAVS